MGENYVEKILGRNEQIVYVGRQHIFVLIGTVLTELLLIVVLVAAGVTSQTAFPDRMIAGQPVGQIVMIACVVISVVVLLSALLDYVRWNNEQYVITENRVISVSGIFDKRVMDAQLEKINEVTLVQSWIGRMFNYGDVVIETASEQGFTPMRRMTDPLGFKRALQEARQHVSEYEEFHNRRLSAYERRPVRPDVEQTLQKLTDLYEQGLLSEDEFEAKRRALLRLN